MIEYKIIEEDDLNKLEKQINELAKEGWYVEKFCQVMTTQGQEYRLTTVLLARSRND